MPNCEKKENDAKETAKYIGKDYGARLKCYLKPFCLKVFEWSLIYFCGYYNVSFGWLMAPLFFLVLRDKQAKEKNVKFDIVRSIANSDEREFLHEIQKFSNLPSWVTFPDMERVEWLNKVMKQIWPYAAQYCKDLCKETIEPAISTALKEKKLPGFKFEKIILGDTPARISGMKVYDNTSRHEIIIDADFIYAGDCKFEVSFATFKAGIKDLQVSGRVRVVMKPLVRQIPLVGGLQVFFLNNPDVDFNLIGIADVLDIPGVSGLLRGIVSDEIAKMMVLPNRFPIQLIENINIVELKAPLPAGALRIQIIEAKNLIKKDFAVMGMGKSDPYCIVRLGSQKFKTKTITNNINPVWNYCCEFVANETSGQEIYFEVFDSDDGLKDEKLGRANLDVQSIFSSGEVDMWLPLSEVKSGRVHIKATWLELSSSTDDLDKQLAEITVLQNMTANPLHTALLSVWVDSATKLNNIPDPFVRLHVANTKQETIVHVRTNDPVFEEGFTFLVRNPQSQELLVEIIDQKTNQLQGQIQLDLNSVLTRKNMEIKGETFALQKTTGGGLASIKLSIILKIFKSSPPSVATTSEVIMTSEVLSDDQKSSQNTTVLQPKSVPEPSKPGEDDKKLLEAVAVTPKFTPHLLPMKIASGPTTVRQRPVATDGEFGLGRIRLTVKYSVKNSLSIIVHEVQALPKEEDGEIPDPYVKIYLLPGRSKDSKRKTDVIKDSCNPIYDEQFEYIVQPSDISQKNVEISVINKKRFFQMQKSDMMGQVNIACDSLAENQSSQWYDLKPAVDDDED